VKNLEAGIKTALNKDLDPAISALSKIYCNQSAYDKLDQLVDGTGRAMLQPDPTNATRMMYKGREIVMLSDGHWANLSGPSRARIAIGSMEEFLGFFNREGFEFATTDVGGSSWRSYSSEVRGIMRCDFEVTDSAAMKLLTIAL
jgi:HK97 family phage major capsid protein